MQDKIIFPTEHLFAAAAAAGHSLQPVVPAVNHRMFLR